MKVVWQKVFNSLTVLICVVVAERIEGVAQSALSDAFEGCAIDQLQHVNLLGPSLELLRQYVSELPDQVNVHWIAAYAWLFWRRNSSLDDKSCKKWGQDLACGRSKMQGSATCAVSCDGHLNESSDLSKKPLKIVTITYLESTKDRRRISVYFL